MPDPLRGRIRSDGTKIYEAKGVRIAITPGGGMSISNRSSKCAVTLRNKDVYIDGIRVEWDRDPSIKEEENESRGFWKDVAVFASMLIVAIGLVFGSLLYIVKSTSSPRAPLPAEAPLK